MAFPELHLPSLASLAFPWLLWPSLALAGFPWASLGFPGPPWASLAFSGFPWPSLDILVPFGRYRHMTWVQGWVGMMSNHGMSESDDLVDPKPSYQMSI